MKFNKTILLAPVVLFSLTGCNKKVRYEPEQYVLNYNDAANSVAYTSNESFNILQLSDIHFTYLAENEYHYQFIKKTISAAKTALAIQNKELHLIVITGDTFTFATKDTIRSACNFFEEQKIPWTITFGNHDEQGYFSVDWMTSYLNKVSKKDGSNLLFIDRQDDDVFGNANFVINLHNNDYAHQDDNRQIIIMDSNRYNYGEGMGYDYIHPDQLDWYKRMYYYFNQINADPTSIAFFHIPLPEYTDAYNKAAVKESLFDTSDVYDGDGVRINKKIKRNVRGESESAPLVNTHFLDRIKNSKWYTKGIFVGHDHINNYAVKYDYSGEGTQDIKLCYGVKATNTVYYDENYLGGQIVKFSQPENGKTSLDDQIQTDLVLHKYSDLEMK